MRKHALSVVDALRSDRLDGLSIFELMKKYSLPKTTVWHHVRGVQLSESQKEVFRSRMGAGARRKEQNWSVARIRAEEFLRTFDEDSNWPVLLSALYWSEGTKQGGFVFTNTDKVMIRVFLKILREKLGIQDKDLDILIRTSKPMNPLTCKKYWSEVTAIPEKSIRINHDDKHNKSKTTYGMCRITIRKGGYHLKLMHCLIQGIAGKILERSRSSMDRTSHS
jgi:hypothetical protein